MPLQYVLHIKKKNLTSKKWKTNKHIGNWSDDGSILVILNVSLLGTNM